MRAVPFQFLDKAKKEEVLPLLFSMLYGNMNPLAPSGDGYAADYALWHSQVSPALEKPPRQVVLLRREGALVGYFQYACTEEVFVMEEFQLLPAVQHTGLFGALYRWLLPQLPPARRVEAWCLPVNVHAQAVLGHLGLRPTAEGGRYLHYVGEMAGMKKLYGL